MQALYIYALFSVAAFSVSPGLARSLRAKRGVLELAGFIECITGRPAKAYIVYGCYCGLGGEGWPRDEADWCCHKHDCCYGEADKMGCQSHTDFYTWTCQGHNHGCEALNDKCEQKLCRCDREFARCLQKAPYNLQYSLWPNFLCGKNQPVCA